MKCLDLFSGIKSSSKPTTSALEWQSKNPWFFKDHEATKKAMEIHTDLLNDGYVADSQEYYSELDKRIHEG